MPSIKNVQFLTVFGNPEVVKSACEGLKSIKYGKSNNTKILYVTHLSSNKNPSPINLSVIQEMIHDGLYGIITSGDFVSYYRSFFTKEELAIIVPGVRIGNDLSNDHYNLNTVASAFAQGANYIVVGRPIIEAKDIVRAAEEYISKIP
jgi:orotidine-5'-phosphate decarboxylase